MTWDANPDHSGVRSITRTGEIIRRSGETWEARLQLTDEALMLAVTGRDECAFAVLYDRYADLVYSASLRVLGDTQQAEDTTQDVFVRLWRRPESFVAERGRFMSWLMSVTRNRAVDELRSRGRRRRREVATGGALDDDRPLQVPGHDDDPLGAAQLHEQQMLVRRALAELPAEQKVALELAYFGGLTQQEISGLLHEPLGTIKTRIRLGMQKLHRSLEDRV